jgi:hypothetical protein
MNLTKIINNTIKTGLVLGNLATTAFAQDKYLEINKDWANIDRNLIGIDTLKTNSTQMRTFFNDLDGKYKLTLENNSETELFVYVKGDRVVLSNDPLNVYHATKSEDEFVNKISSSTMDLSNADEQINNIPEKINMKEVQERTEGEKKRYVVGEKNSFGFLTDEYGHIKTYNFRTNENGLTNTMEIQPINGYNDLVFRCAGFDENLEENVFVEWRHPDNIEMKLLYDGMSIMLSRTFQSHLGKIKLTATEISNGMWVENEYIHLETPMGKCKMYKVSDLKGEF